MNSSCLLDQCKTLPGDVICMRNTFLRLRVLKKVTLAVMLWFEIPFRALTSKQSNILLKLDTSVLMSLKD